VGVAENNIPRAPHLHPFLLENNEDSAICLCKDIRKTNYVEVTFAYSLLFSYENYFLRQLKSIF
jgi:hypothetical protein